MSSRGGLILYKQLLRAGQQFQDYNFRSYTLRRVRDAFKASKSFGAEEREQGLLKAREGLQLIRRQTTIGELYGTGPMLSIEHAQKAAAK